MENLRFAKYRDVEGNAEQAIHLVAEIFSKYYSDDSGTHPDNIKLPGAYYYVISDSKNGEKILEISGNYLKRSLLAGDFNVFVEAGKQVKICSDVQYTPEGKITQSNGKLTRSPIVKGEGEKVGREIINSVIEIAQKRINLDASQWTRYIIPQLQKALNKFGPTQIQKKK